MRNFLRQFFYFLTACTLVFATLLVCFKIHTINKEVDSDEKFSKTYKRDFLVDDNSNQFIISNSQYEADDSSKYLITDFISKTQSSIDKSKISLKYKVQQSDTLMLIAFNYYSDWRQWREIYAWNKEKISLNYSLRKGQILNLYGDLRKYRPPTGLPYLVKRGDYLTKISRKVYGTSQKWIRIWKNNSLQIRDPNLIFSGFTLFYPSSSRLY